MIYANSNITIKKDVSVCDSPILLYKGDRNVEIRIKILNNRFIILNDLYAQILIHRPKTEPIVSGIYKIEDDTVVFLITGDMIDDSTEIGEYSFQIRLYDDELNARISLPPCLNGVVIKNPLVESSNINAAMINASRVIPVNVSLDIFTPDEKYVPTQWYNGDIISDARMNKIEKAIYEISKRVNKDDIEMWNEAYQHSQSDHLQPSDLDIYATIEYVDDAIESVDLPEEDKEKINVAYEHSQSDHLKPEDLVDTYATIEFVNEAVESVDLPLEDREKINAAYEHSQSEHVSSSDLKQYATIEYVNNKVGSEAASSYISTISDSNLMLEVGSTIQIDLDFVSPNAGYGTLKIAVNDIETKSVVVNQGANVIDISDDNLKKGDNKLSLYVIDRRGVMSNTLIFTVRYGSLEFTPTFNQNTSYDVGAPIRYYFTPSVLDTSKTLTFKMQIDDGEIDSMICINDTRAVYTFSNDLDAGVHKCEAWITDGTNESPKHVFNLVLLDANTICVAPDEYEEIAEEGSQITIDYRVYSKNNETFMVNVYDGYDEIFTGSCGIGFNQYRTSSLKEGNHDIRIRISNDNGDKTSECTIKVTITHSTFTMYSPVQTGGIFIADAKDRTNTDTDKNVWVGHDQDGNEVIATLNEFSFDSKDGWLDNTLVCSGAGNIIIPVSPFSDNAKYGMTFDITFLTRKIGVQNAEVLSVWNDEKDCGIKITTDEIILKSAKGNVCDLYFPEDEWINAIIIIDRDQKMAKIYLNGVMCEAFALSDYNDNGIDYLEDFEINDQIRINEFGGYCAIRNINIYNLSLTTEEILNNFIATRLTKSEQQQLAEFQKGDHLPTMTIYCDFSGLGKDDKKPCDIVYNSPNAALYGESFALTGKTSLLQYQGTSSMAYPIKNYRINLYDQNGEKWKYNPYSSGQPESRFCLKADFMSSGHWQNTGLAKWINDNLYSYNISDEKSMNPSKWYDVQNDIPMNAHRETINGFPCRLILINDGSTPLNEGQNEPTPGNTKDMGIFNFNNDKDNTSTLGFNTDIFPYCASYEVAANSDTSAGAFISYKGDNNDEELEYLQQSFELRFPDDKKVGKDYGYLNLKGDATKGLKRVIDWVDNCTDEEFVSDFEQYFHKQYTFRYYLLVIVLGMVDNLGKNMMFDTFDHKIWIPRFYDMDTICSYDNTGQIKFDVDIEMEQGYWNTSASRLWTRIRDLFHDELIIVYKDMRANGMSYESFMSYFYDQQIAQIPQKYYNMDADVKYLPFADAYIGKAHGDGYEHLRRWLKNRLIFTDTLFDYQPSYINDVMTIRANTTNQMTLEIETFTPVYQHLSWYNGQMDKKKIDGKESVEFSGYAQAATDQEVLIYGGTNIKSVKGISTCNPSQLLIGSATRISELDSSNSPILTDINSDKANLLPHVYLNTINLSNCNTLGGTLKISNSPLIKDIDISNTQITDLQLPPNLRNLEKITLTNTIKSLSLKHVPLLTDMMIPSDIEYLCIENASKLTRLTVSSCTKLKTFIAENVGFNPISQILSKANNLKRIRLMNLDVTCSYTDIVKISKLIGVDKNGADAPISECVTGKVTLGTCSENIIKELETSFPNVDFTVLSYIKSYNVTFVDGDGNILYECQTLENGEAIYLGETPNKTSTAQYDYTWKGWDRQLKPITSDAIIHATFEAILRYYTIKFINSDTLEVVSEQVLGYGSTPIVPDIPEGFNAWKPSAIESVTKDFDYYTQYIPYPEDLSIFNFYSITVNGVSGYTCELKTDNSAVRDMKYIIIPFEYNGKPVLSYSQTELPSFTYLSVEEFYVPDSLVALGNHAFCNTNKLKSDLVFPNVSTFTYSNTYVTDIIEQMFDHCHAPKIAFPKIQRYTVYDYEDGSPFGNSGSNLVIFGSPEYPFKSWSDDTSYNAGSFDCPDNDNVIINLVTENGLASDVTIKMTDISLTDRFIFTKAPMLFGVTDNGFEYIIDDNGCSIISYSGNDTEVTIPNEIENVIVTKIGKRVFTGNTTITKVNAPNVTSLGNSCFNKCTNLTSVDLPNATTLGDSCFYNCSKLTSVDLPNATTLSNNCFSGCSRLTSISLPNVTTLGSSCFYRCGGLTSMDLPNVTSLGASCFDGCIYLTSVDLPNVISLGASCFNDCDGLTSIELPLVTSLGASCFNDCDGLTSVKLPLVTSLGNDCFRSCNNLTSIELPLVTRLGNACFSWCANLTSIKLPLVTSLGNDCFYYCKALASIELPLVTSLGNDCFEGCNVLSSIELPLVTSIGKYCFRYCTGLTSITFGHIGKPISDTSKFSTSALDTDVTTLTIYVTSPSSPPTLSGSPWGATSATIAYEQA